MRKKLDDKTFRKNLFIIIATCGLTGLLVLDAYINLKDRNITFGTLLIIVGAFFVLAQVLSLYNSNKYISATLMVLYDSKETIDNIVAIIEANGYERVQSPDSGLVFRFKHTYFKQALISGQITAEIHDFCIVLRGPKPILDKISSQFKSKFNWSDNNSK